MREKIDTVARRIKSSYERLAAMARSARDADPSLVRAVPKAPLSVSVCAVDGGLLSARLHGADLAVVRAVGVNFVYRGAAFTFSHHPQKSPEPELEIQDSLDEHESLAFRSLVRLRAELRCASECVAKHSPDALLLDGSLLPLPNDRPPEGSALAPLYAEVVSLYLSLRESCALRSCMLCGVVKDTRSRKLASRLGLGCSDGVLCGFLLEPGERTAAMPYDDKPKGELAKLTEGTSVFYIKPSAGDIPLRIETGSADVERAASLILALCAVSESYAYPAILVEADMCAALDGSEIEPIESSLLSLSGMRPLRRNSRPFR